MQESDLYAICERCVWCDETQRSSEARSPHLGCSRISNFDLFKEYVTTTSDYADDIELELTFCVILASAKVAQLTNCWKIVQDKLSLKLLESITNLEICWLKSYVSKAVRT